MIFFFEVLKIRKYNLEFNFQNTRKKISKVKKKRSDFCSEKIFRKIFVQKIIYGKKYHFSKILIIFSKIFIKSFS